MTAPPSPGPTPQDPFARFAETFRRASEQPPFDPTAMTLATVSREEIPSARIVLLKRHDESGFYFYTNYHGRKAGELDATRRAALCFYWPWINEQVRVEGTVERASDEESDRYFASRNRTSQLGAWASQQSQPLESREKLMGNLQEMETRFAGQPVPRPPFWGGYRLVPLVIEFWINGEFRLHDRFVYSRPAETEKWQVRRLYP